MAQKLLLKAPVTVSTAGTRVPLNTTSVIATDIIITADPGNSGVIYVGDDSVSDTNGIPLSAGDNFVVSTSAIRGTQEDFDLKDVYIDSDTNGSIVRVAYIKRQ